MAVLQKVKKAAILTGVIAVGVIAGAFLASWRALGASPGRPDAGEPDGGRASRRADAGHSVDVGQVEQGQPAVRNYME
jgi:hypothetical protein